MWTVGNVLGWHMRNWILTHCVLGFKGWRKKSDCERKWQNITWIWTPINVKTGPFFVSQSTDSYKVNPAYADTSLLIVHCNRPFLSEGKNFRGQPVDVISDTIYQIGWIVDVNFQTTCTLASKQVTVCIEWYWLGNVQIKLLLGVSMQWQLCEG